MEGSHFVRYWVKNYTSISATQKHEMNKMYSLIIVGVNFRVSQRTRRVFLPTHQICVHRSNKEWHIIAEADNTSSDRFHRRRPTLVHACVKIKWIGLIFSWSVWKWWWHQKIMFKITVHSISMTLNTLKTIFQIMCV